MILLRSLGLYIYIYCREKAMVLGEVVEPTPSLQKPPEAHAKHIGGATPRGAAAHLTGSLTIPKI